MQACDDHEALRLTHLGLELELGRQPRLRARDSAVADVLAPQLAEEEAADLCVSES